MSYVRISKPYRESLNRQINGLLSMNRLAVERINALEERCARIEQATLEMAQLLRQVSPAGVGSLPSPAGDDLKVQA